MKNAELQTKLVADLKRVVGHSEELLENTAETIGGKVHEIRERLNDALEEARDTCRKLEDKSIEGARAADKSIREHPYRSIVSVLGTTSPALRIRVLSCGNVRTFGRLARRRE